MKQWPYHFQSSMSNVLVIVAALMAIFLVIYGLYRILRNPFHYPYFVRSFDVSRKRNVDIEDYIDSLVIELRTTNEYVMNLTVRKFWRYIKRVNKHEQYEACLNGQMSGMATFKEPIEHWMTSIEVKDKYENLKTDEGELREKIG